MPHLVGSEEHLLLPSKRPWPCAHWEAGRIWQQLMQTFPRLQGIILSHTKIPAGSFILKPLPSAVGKLIWEKRLDDKARKIW